MKVGYPHLPPGIAKQKIGNFQGAGAGAQAITGVGFVPKIVQFFAKDNNLANDAHSHGFDNGSTRHCVFKRGSAAVVDMDTTRSIVLYRSDLNIIRGYISSMDADGFTITWDLTGAVVVDVIYLAMR